MPEYVDGFVLAVPKKRVADYKKLAKLANKIWREHGALDYRECVGEDLKSKWGVPFGKLIKVKPTETVVFAWITFKSRKHRDAVNKKVMADPRMKCPDSPPFDMKRFSYGGFETLVK
jgi:uncharacterized protein YbaA (DUF1428 family)